MAKSGKKQTLQSMIMRPMVIVHVIIIVIFISTINTFDIIGRLRGAEVDNLSRAVSIRGRQIEQRLLSLGAAVTRVSSSLAAAWPEDRPVPESLGEDDLSFLLEEALPLLSDALRPREATGAFVALDGSLENPARGGIEGSQAAAIYLIDEAVSTYSGESGEVMMLIGPQALAQDSVLPLEPYWSEELWMHTFSDTAFLTRVFEAGQAYPGHTLQRLSLWSQPVTMHQNRSALMVTVPLRIGEQTVGVVGVELSMDRLRSLLPATELYDGDTTFYALTEASGEALLGSFFLTTGPFATRHMRDEDSLESIRQRSDYGENVVEIRLADSARATAVEFPLGLYYQDSPFRDQAWSLVGGIENSAIFSSTQNLIIILIAAFALAILVALVFAYLISVYLEHPLRKLSKQLQLPGMLDVDSEPMQLEHTDILEVDQLIDSIQSLSGALADSGQRTIRAIEMTGMPIGFIETNPEKGYVFLTDLAFSLLELRQEPGVNTISLAEWEEIYQRLLRHPESSEEDVFHLQSPDAQQLKYLRLRTASDQARSFGILMDVTAEILSRQALAHGKDTDSLTDLYNRKAFLNASQSAIARNPGKLGLMLFADLDHLKVINDTYGHDVGDRYIQSAAQLFAQLARQGGIVSRISGDEFAIFLYGYDEAGSMKKLLTGLARKLDDEDPASILLPDNTLAKVEYTMSYACYPEDAQDPETLLRYADYAMHEIKQRTRGGIHAFSMASYMENVSQTERSLAFTQVVEHNLVRYAFQPIVDVQSGQVFGYEALMRPQSEAFPEPHQLLHVAQNPEQQYQIERLTFQNVFAWIALHEPQLQGLRVFINSIPDQSLSAQDFDRLQKEYDGLFHYVIMEVTEAQHSSEVFLQNKLSTWRKLGVGIAIDDYGSGYANSVAVLTTHPDYLKIDMNLVESIDAREDKQNMLSTIVEYAKRSGIKVIAEGVETTAELSCVVRLGVDYVQGFLVGKPEYELKPISLALKQTLRDIHADLDGGAR